MKPGRPNQDFHAIDTVSGFEPRPGGVDGITQKILGDDFDPARRKGSRTRLLRMAPGCETPEAHAHDYVEELYILEGDLIAIDGPGRQRRFEAPSFACRAPGAMHGPVRTETGCLMLEFAWYPDGKDGETA